MKRTKAKSPVSRKSQPLPRLRSNITHLRPNSPFRPFDWRWQLAHILLDNPEKVERYSDPVLLRLVSTLRLAPRFPAQAARAWPALVEARRLFEATEPVAVRQRVDLEGYILAGETDEALAKRFNLDVDLVRTYEAVYYDVRSRLACPDELIWYYVDLVGGTVDEDDWQSWTRLTGIIMGSVCLDAYVRYRSQPRPTLTKKFDDMTDDELFDLRDRLVIRRVLLCTFPDISPSNHRYWRTLDILVELGRHGDYLVTPWSGEKHAV